MRFELDRKFRRRTAAWVSAPQATVAEPLILAAHVARGATCRVVLRFNIRTSGHKHGNGWAHTSIRVRAHEPCGATRCGISDDLVIGTRDIGKIDRGAAWTAVASRTACGRIILQDSCAAIALGHDQGNGSAIGWTNVSNYTTRSRVALGHRNPDAAEWQGHVR